MGKRKRSKSKDYDSILKKVKKLEEKIRKKRYRSLSESESEKSHFSDYDADFPGEDNIDDEVIYLNDGSQENTEASISLTEPVVPPSPPPLPLREAIDDDGNPKRTDAAVTALLDPDILQLLGEDPTEHKSVGENLQKDIASRWNYILTNGLPKDTQLDLVKRYLPPENCLNMRAPKLNLEIKAALSEINVKKDMYSQSKQNQIASSLAAIGQVLNLAIASKDKIPEIQEIIKPLSDAGRLICDCHYRESQSRRYAVMNTLNKSIRDTIKNTKIDEHLFGSDLSDHIKSSKAISKTGLEMKSTPRPPYRPPLATLPQRGALNSRGAPPRAAAPEPRPAPAPRRPARDRRQDATRGRRSTGYTRQQTRRR